MKVGDEVRVFNINGSRMGHPSGGWVGVVTKVGRKLFTVDYPGARWNSYKERGDVFRLDTMRLNSKEWGYRTWVRTVDEVKAAERRSKVAQELKERGLEVSQTSTLDITLLEGVAEFLRDNGND